MQQDFLFLLPIAFITGAVNAVAGGGGLIQVPGLFAALPSATPALIMGTDKFAAIMGHTTAMRQYTLRLALPWKLVLVTALCAFIGSLAGVSVMSSIPPRWMRGIVIIVLAVMLAYTWFRPRFGIHDESKPITRNDLLKALIAGFAIGFYDGFVGPGTGSFLLFLFVRFFHFDFLKATACAKVVNLATNLAALSFLVPTMNVLYRISIPMGVAGIAGAWMGSRLAIKGGNQWIRRLFLVLAATLLIKLSWQWLAAG
jgi:uncharacterized membrane protein YfcA